MKKIIFSISLMIGSLSLFAVDNLGLFELDGNVTNGGLDDWNNVYLNSSSAPITNFVVDGVISNGTEANTFGNSDKDIDTISTWGVRTNGANNKTDINHAYFAGYVYSGSNISVHQAGDVILYYGLNGAPTGGAFTTGFWVLQDSTIAPVGTSWNGAHQTGDILILGLFSGNGSFSVDAYTWTTGGLQLVAGGGVCNGSNHIICGQTNPSALIGSVAWSTGTTPANSIEANRFFEAGVNLSAIYRSIGRSLPCSNKILFESRTSEKINSTLKDFVLSDYSICGSGSGINVDKTSVTTDATTGDTVTYDVTISNTGLAPITKTTIIDSLAGDMTVTVPSSCTTIFGQSSCSFSYDYTTPANSPNPLINVATANFTQVTSNAISANDDHSINMSYLSDLSITKTSNSASYSPGSNDSYIITVTNNGVDSVTSALVSDTLRSGLSTVQANISCSPAANCTAINLTGQLIEVTLDIANGEAVVITVPVAYSADPNAY